jgi:hypothetical protein
VGKEGSGIERKRRRRRKGKKVRKRTWGHWRRIGRVWKRTGKVQEKDRE